MMPDRKWQTKRALTPSTTAPLSRARNGTTLAGAGRISRQFRCTGETGTGTSAARPSAPKASG